MQHAELVSYFVAERNGALILLGIATVSLIAAYLLWQFKGAFVAMIWPLVLLGMLEVVIGGTVALRTPSQIRQLEAGLETDRAATISEELTRMERIERNFKIAKVGEALVIAVGICAVLLLPTGSLWYAIALGVIIHGAALLVFDSFAHQRAEVYMEWLQRI